ncbi:uncharacterized protein LOC107619217 isoform X2 [Arachis ipaensis]|uniref:uncharacterized protein LOC107619217 isoform X2 n=1 Tax=Arachis ipaensis TaxID=130454 RepID=UPI000A2B610E|nr:uncharacterized protein LOC107619217 isoform X2 [Arachis ipaensis]
MTVQDIPKSMNLVFRPTDDMNLSGVELVVATYIFMRHLPESEILIDIGDCYATRGALMTLAPKMEVVDDVLNTVVCMLTLASNTNAWFLPMTIMQAAVGGRSLTSANIRSIRNNYMRSKVDQVTRVYQPMWCDQHWYLMIIDVREQKLIYVDSLRDPREADARKTAMMRVALYLEGMTLGNSWLSGDGAMRPRFFAFKYEEPDVPQQHGLWHLGSTMDDTSAHVARLRGAACQRCHSDALSSRLGDEVSQPTCTGLRIRSIRTLADGNCVD